jgi:hypothetical protein
MDMGSLAKIAAKLGVSLAALIGFVEAEGKFHENDPEIDPAQEEINYQIKDGLGDRVLDPNGEQDSTKVAKWPGKTSESRINRAVMESIRRYKRNRV